MDRTTDMIENILLLNNYILLFAHIDKSHNLAVDKIRVLKQDDLYQLTTLVHYLPGPSKMWVPQ